MLRAEPRARVDRRSTAGPDAINAVLQRLPLPRPADPPRAMTTRPRGAAKK